MSLWKTKVLAPGSKGSWLTRGSRKPPTLALGLAPVQLKVGCPLMGSHFMTQPCCSAE